MKNYTRVLYLLIVLMLSGKTYAQQTVQPGNENYGKTLNIGIGLGGYAGYYSYIGHELPVLHLDYEFDIANQFTLAPFISFFTYSQSYYWGSNKNPYRYYNYHQTVIPIGIKGTYYFDRLLRLNQHWDLYAAGSFGFAFVSTRWDTDYYGDKKYYQGANPLFVDLHIGGEYHFRQRLGLIVDLSTGVSSIGLAIHN